MKEKVFPIYYKPVIEPKIWFSATTYTLLITVTLIMSIKKLL